MSRTNGKAWTQRGVKARRRYRRTIRFGAGTFARDAELHRDNYNKEYSK